jgi:hypothetical protein
LTSVQLIRTVKILELLAPVVTWLSARTVADIK